MSRRWVPTLKPPRSCTVPCVSELAVTIMEALEKNAWEKRKELFRIWTAKANYRFELPILIESQF